MMHDTTSRHSRLITFFLFSGMGCFSYLFLILNSDLPSLSRVNLASVWAFVVVVLVFNGLGFSVLGINHRLKRDYLSLIRRRRMVVYCVAIGVALLLLNYWMMVIIKYAVGALHPFHFRFSGVRMLFIIWLVELIIISLAMASNFYRQSMLLFKRTAELEESAVHAQYLALQSQLNPHFLFNSLNTLISEITYSPTNAVLFTRHLSDVYRYVLQRQEQRLVTLATELEFLESYIFLHRVRLGDCISLDCAIEGDLEEIKLPPLTLQLLAENVIKHNTIHASKPMVIHLAISSDGKKLIVSNPIHIKKDVARSGMGLRNLSARYRLICDCNIEISSDKDCFTVNVPLLYE